MTKHLVVVGGGQAAVQLVQTARKLGFDGRITMIAEEPHLPYQRPPLSKKYLAGELGRDRLLLKPEHFYPDKGIDIVLSSRAEELDIHRRALTLGNGRSLSFDALALATGSRARRLDLPGAMLDGIHYVRTIADIDALRADLAPGQRAVIVGAGYIGLEVAAVMVGLGLEVTVLEASFRVLSRVVCAEVADFYAAYHARAGVKIYCNAVVERFAGTRHVTAVETADREHYACDLVVVGVGVEPNVELAARAGLACDDGIRVDACARTAHGDIVAAGDCTSHPQAFAPRRVRLESVNNAVEQGKAAAASLVGQSLPFEDVPWFWSDQYDLKLQIAGLAIDYDETVVRGRYDDERFAVYYLRGGRPIAVDAINSPRDFMNAKKLIAARPTVARDMLADPSADLSAYWSPA